MTLVEVMAAMAILAMVATLLYSAFVQTSRNKEHIEGQLERYHEICSGMERIAQELSMAYTSAHRNINESLRTMITAFIAKDQGNNTRVDFSSFSHRRLYRNAHESDQNELGYFVAQDPNPKHSSQKVLARREQRRVDDDPKKGGQSQILIENVKRFELSFLDPLTTEWVTTWDTTSAQANRLPTQAKIVLIVPNIQGHGPDQTFATRTWFPNTYALNFALYKP
jgi:general secretion pathway protein J